MKENKKNKNKKTSKYITHDALFDACIFSFQNTTQFLL